MTEQQITEIFTRQVDTIYRVCYAYMGNAADTEDAVQETFVKLMRSNVVFNDVEHEKAWLIRVAVNHCKDVLKSSSRKNVALDSVGEPVDERAGLDETLKVVLELEPKYKDAVYLHYYEGYTTEEIGEILGHPPSTIRNHLSEARRILKRELGGEWR
ncbi:MAG: RNA polymerase sigma factor [bacterium]|nr:RNA polymerase sigma factor [bacterium]